MNCPKCKANALVKDSRPGQGYVYRRRRCESCDFRFSTVELPRDTYDEIAEAFASAWKTAAAELLRIKTAYKRPDLYPRGSFPDGNKSPRSTATKTLSKGS